MIAESLQHLRMALPDNVKLLAVSKFQPIEAVKEAYDAGQRLFGESRATELAHKAQQLQGYEDIEWHFIGHPQTNKLRDIIRYAHTIQSVDSVYHLNEIDKEAQKQGKTVNCYLQYRVAQEAAKQGFRSERDLAEAMNIGYTNVNISGVMAMATLTDNREQIRSEFVQVAECCKHIPAHLTVSMGMSEDYPVAIEVAKEYGLPLMIRLGTIIFGQR